MPPFFLVHVAETGHPTASECLDPSTFKGLPQRGENLSVPSSNVWDGSQGAQLVRCALQDQSALARGAFIHNLSPRALSLDQQRQ